ncbi:MAG: hypothetical protein ACOX18_06475 [Bacillota bacterium]|jgi:chromosome segregation ATPase
MSIESINQRLLEITEQREQLLHRQRMLQSATEELAAQRQRLAQLEAQLRKEERDVKALEGISLANLFRTVLGDKEQRLDKERQEFVRAKLRYDAAQSAVDRLEEEVAQLRAAIRRLPELQADYQELLREKEQALAQRGGAEHAAIFELSSRLAELRSRQKELREAIAAGKDVQGRTESMLRSLDSAAGWGVWDMIGGGFLSTMVKHSHIDDARQLAHDAQQSFRVFARELRDVNLQLDLNIEISGFLRFADYFFDGLIADWTVQSRINKALDEIKKQQRSVTAVMQRLETDLRTVEKQLEQVAAEREAALARA